MKKTSKVKIGMGKFNARYNVMEGIESMRKELSQLQREYETVCDERDAMKLERDEMHQYHDSAMAALSDTLGLDTSDGESRFKWVNLAISDLKQQVSAGRGRA